MGFLEQGAHWDYVIAAYAATFVIMAALVWASVAQARRARRDLEGLEASAGPRRRRAS
jgi:heme exporter protein CcmD